MQNIRKIRSFDQYPDFVHVIFSGQQDTADLVIFTNKVRIHIAESQIFNGTHGKLPVQAIPFVILSQRDPAPALDLDTAFICRQHPACELLCFQDNGTHKVIRKFHICQLFPHLVRCRQPACLIRLCIQIIGLSYSVTE